MNRIAIGIDLGTTNSCVATLKSDKKVHVIPNHYGNRTTPSVVYFSAHQKMVGEEAQSMRSQYPQNTVYQIKRFMGMSAKEVAARGKEYPFEVLANRKGEASIRVKPVGSDTSNTLCPQQISSYILHYMKKIASNHLKGTDVEAVITVPANFNNAQREATKLAANMAGLNVLRIINEPTAAALAYAFQKKWEEKRVVLVFDLGGGTFDVSIVRTNESGGEVLATEGDMNLGGEDFDQRLYDHVAAEWTNDGDDGSISEREKADLLKALESAKRTLSASEEATIIYSRKDHKINKKLTREIFEEICSDLFEKTIDVMERAVESSGVTKDEIDEIILVGGSSRIPRVQKLLQDAFDDKKMKFDLTPDHAVAQGAAILAASLSAEAADQSVRGRIQIADVLPFSLGTGLTLDRFSVILKKNTQYPATNTCHYTTSEDNAPAIVFLILEGENALASRNTELAKCFITMPPKAIEDSKVEVTFSVDADGILSVHIEDKQENNVVTRQIQTTTMSNDERMAMIHDAKKEEEEDEKRRVQLEARNEYADAVYSLKRSMHDQSLASIHAVIQKRIEMENDWLKDNTAATNDEFVSRGRRIRAEHSTLKRNMQPT